MSFSTAGAAIASVLMLVIYVLIFLLIATVVYFIVRKAVKDGILDARAKIGELEDQHPGSESR